MQIVTTEPKVGHISPCRRERRREKKVTVPRSYKSRVSQRSLLGDDSFLCATLLPWCGVQVVPRVAALYRRQTSTYSGILPKQLGVKHNSHFQSIGKKEKELYCGKYGKGASCICVLQNTCLVHYFPC